MSDIPKPVNYEKMSKKELIEALSGMSEVNQSLNSKIEQQLEESSSVGLKSVSSEEVGKQPPLIKVVPEEAFKSFIKGMSPGQAKILSKKDTEIARLIFKNKGVN